MTKLERCQRAKEFHEKGLNCGQAVLLAFTDVTGLTEQQSMAVASGFGGGLRCGGVCGVVNAAAVVLGVERLHGAAVRCTDLRGGAALCAAALAAEGETAISDITHIDRGYQSIEDDLAALGADIRRGEETASP